MAALSAGARAILEARSNDPFGYLGRIVNAGEILLGENTPLPLGNFVLGPNAVLPTSGQARTCSPLSVFDFMKRSSIGYVTAAAILDGNVLPEQFTPARLDGDDIWELLNTTEVDLDESLADAPVAQRFRTDLTVTTDDGTVHHTRIEQPHGAPSDPVTNDEIA